MALTKKIDEIPLLEIFKLINIETQINCRLVCRNWNRILTRMSNVTKKMPSDILLIFCHENGVFNLCNEVEMRNGKRKRKSYDCYETIPLESVLRNVETPSRLIIHYDWKCDEDDVYRINSGITTRWSRNIQQLEIVTYSNVKMAKILNDFSKFQNISFLSFSHYCNETLSLNELFHQLPFLENIRIFAFNGNDGSGESSGLVFDNLAVDTLTSQQISRQFRYERIEVYNTDILFSPKQIIQFIISSSKLPVSKKNSKKIENSTIDYFYLLFENCNWETIKPQQLVEIFRELSLNRQPQMTSDIDQKFCGEYRFIVNRLNVVLNFL